HDFSGEAPGELQDERRGGGEKERERYTSIGGSSSKRGCCWTEVKRITWRESRRSSEFLKSRTTAITQGERIKLVCKSKKVTPEAELGSLARLLAGFPAWS